MTFHVVTGPDGRRGYQVGFHHQRPVASALFAVYALPQGIVVAPLPMGGIRSPWPPPLVLTRRSRRAAPEPTSSGGREPVSPLGEEPKNSPTNNRRCALCASRSKGASSKPAMQDPVL